MRNLEKENKGLKILVIVFVLVGLGFYYYCSTYLNKCPDSVVVQDDNNYTYNDMEGVYNLSTNVELDGTIENAGAFLYLWKNGTFKYVQSVLAPMGQMGNYIIEDNTIVLNCFFETNSGTGLRVMKETKTLSIKSATELEDLSIKWGTVSFSGTLTKTNDNINSYENYNIYNMLNNNEVVTANNN